jgi:TM2 domain-containing membrane protein YozV
MSSKTSTAYGLWLFSFVGLSGIHRFYLGKPVSGVIYLLTWGLFGIGQLIDLFFMPALVAERNLQESKQQALLPPNHTPVPGPLPFRLDIQILRLCRDRDGATLSDCVIETASAPEIVKETVSSLCRDGLLIVDNRIPDGAVIYRAI